MCCANYSSMQVGIFCLMWVICAPLLLGSSSNMDTDNNKKELKKDPQKKTNPKELTGTARIIPLLCHFYCQFHTLCSFLCFCGHSMCACRWCTCCSSVSCNFHKMCSSLLSPDRCVAINVMRCDCRCIYLFSTRTWISMSMLQCVWQLSQVEKTKSKASSVNVFWCVCT